MCWRCRSLVHGIERASAAADRSAAFSICVDSTSTVVLGVDLSDTACTLRARHELRVRRPDRPDRSCRCPGPGGGVGPEGPDRSSGRLAAAARHGWRPVVPVWSVSPAGPTGPVGATGPAGPGGPAGLGRSARVSRVTKVSRVPSVRPVVPVVPVLPVSSATVLTVIGASSTVSGAALGALTAPVDAVCPPGTILIGGGSRRTHTGAARGGLLQTTQVTPNTWRARGSRHPDRHLRRSGFRHRDGLRSLPASAVVATSVDLRGGQRPSRCPPSLLSGLSPPGPAF